MAQHKVAFYLERGYGCQKDAKAAIEWYEKACAEGNSLPMEIWNGSRNVSSVSLKYKRSFPL